MSKHRFSNNQSDSSNSYSTFGHFELSEKEEVSNWYRDDYDRILKIINTKNIDCMSDDDYLCFSRKTDGTSYSREETWGILHCFICKNIALNDSFLCLPCEFCLKNKNK